MKITMPVKCISLRILLLLSVTSLFSACGGGGGSGGGSSDSSGGGEITENVAPIIGGVPVTMVRVGDSYSFQPSSSDPDGDTLSFSASNLPDWMYVDTSTGELYGDPDFHQTGTFRDITLTVSDGEASQSLAPFAVDVVPPLLKESNFVSSGTVTPTADGYRSEGDLQADFGNGSTLMLEDADLDLNFDDDGIVTSFNGETKMPQEITDGLNINSSVRGGIGLYWGYELNADETINITLKDDRQYLAFFIDTGIDIEVGNPGDPDSKESLTITTPASGTIILISDPFDPMHYRFAATPLLGEYGEGKSSMGLLPFIPSQERDEIEPFDGHDYQTGSYGIGIKVFDVLTVAGERLFKNPSFADIDFVDPFNSTIEYKAGLNGDFSFDFGVFGFGLFSFDIAEGSAMLDIGFDEQSYVMSVTVAPDVSWAPDWFLFLPTTEIVGNFYVDGTGTLEASLSGLYQSQLPVADVRGEILVENDMVTMTGVVVDRITLPISVVFAEDLTEATVGINVDFSSEVDAAVDAGFDHAEERLDQAIADLETATEDYQFEVSLRGLRTQLPAIADTAIAILNSIPGTVRNEVDSAVVTKIRNTTKCKTFVFEVCVDAEDYVNETAIGDQAGASAQSQAAANIDPYVAAMEELKFQAQQADDEALRAALEAALYAAYDYRTFSESFSVTVSLGSVNLGVGTIPLGSVSHTETVNEQILTSSQANSVLTAAQNAYRIQETSDIKISAQAVVDELPTEEVIANTRERVDAGTDQVPGVDSVRYVVDHGAYTATVVLTDGSEHSVDFNVLSVDEAITGIGDLLANYVIEN